MYINSAAFIFFYLFVKIARMLTSKSLYFKATKNSIRTGNLFFSRKPTVFNQYCVEPGILGYFVASLQKQGIARCSPKSQRLHFVIHLSLPLNFSSLRQQ